MKIKINQKELSKHIGIAQKGISNRTTLQILNGILLETNNDKLKITATDLELSVETFVDCNIEKEGSVVINSKIFGDIIRKLPNSVIEIEVTEKDGNKYMNIQCENSEFNIIGNSADDYPQLPIIVEKESFKLPKDIFKNAIRQTVFAASQEETRLSLTGVLMEVKEGNISFVALDGFRLALRKIKVDSDLNIKMIVPARVLSEVNKIIEDNEDYVEISYETGHILFNLGETTIYSKLLEGQFFNYEDIIRKDHETALTVNKRDLQNSLERASLLAKEEKANLIILEINQSGISIKSKSEIGNVHEDIEAKVEGDNVDIAFNANYLLEGIRTIDSEDISLNFMGNLNPCIMNPADDENHIYLVLPVRLG